MSATPTEKKDEGKYIEIFRDDFQWLDRNVWKFDIGKGPNDDGWGNGELQIYTDERQNAFVKDGVLHVRAIRSNRDENAWTSARLTTRGTFSFAYGRVEARVRTERVDGPFSAVWALSEGAHDPRVGWPVCGEIDVFEMQTKWDYIPASLHFHDHHASTCLSYQNKNMAGMEHDWHIYAAEWTPDSISFYHDDQIIGRYDKPSIPTPHNWPYCENNQFYLIINNAIGASWATKPSSDLMLHDVEIDWISVSRKEVSETP